MALPFRTTGSLKPTFVPARLVRLAVKHPYAFTLLVRCPTVPRVPLCSSVTLWEEHEGVLIMVGNHEVSVKAKARLTARQTCRAGTKVGLSDPVVLYGRAIAQRIKGTPGITG